MFHPEKKSINTGGLLLTEVLVAVAALTAGVIALGTITTSAISTAILSRDYLVADSLAIEAVETVKNLPFTNQLRKPGKKKCWLMLDANCSTFPQPSNYIVSLNNGLFELKSAGASELDLDTGLNSNSQPYQLYLENGMYVGSTDAKAANLKTRFFRSVKFTSVNDVNYDSAVFEVKVQWKDGAKTREIKEVIGLDNSI